jgi:hypothetical protein
MHPGHDPLHKFDRTAGRIAKHPQIGRTLAFPKLEAPNQWQYFGQFFTVKKAASELRRVKAGGIIQR